MPRYPFRRGPRYPFRKPLDLTPELIERARQDEARLAATRAKLEAERAAAAAQIPPATSPINQQPGNQPPRIQPQTSTQISQEKPAMSEHRPTHSPEPENQISDLQSHFNDFLQSTFPVYPEAAGASQTHLGDASPNFPFTPLPSPANPNQRAARKTRKSRTRKTPPSRKPRSPKAFATTEPGSPLERHARKCRICHHPERDAIEADFIEWRHPARIAEDYDLDYSAIYRHARAVGILQLRRENLCTVVEKVLEEVDYIEKPSAFAVLRAVRTLACLTGATKWTEPPTTHIVLTAPPLSSPNPLASADIPAPANSPQPSPPHSHVLPEALTSPAPAGSLDSQSAGQPAPAIPSAPAVPPASSSFPGPELQTSPLLHPNRHTYEKLEPPVSHRKQSPEDISNRHNL